jgi:hypothetical protein
MSKIGQGGVLEMVRVGGSGDEGREERGIVEGV